MTSMNDHRSTRRHDERGIAVIWVAVFLLVSLWFVSLAIDMGKLMAAKTELQAAADAAALAGAASVDLTTGAIIPDSAVVHATYTGGLNNAYEGNETPVVIDPADVSFPAANQVRVIVRREAATGNPVLTHFAQTLGVPNLSVNADATAQVNLIGEPCEHLAPFAPDDVPAGAFVSDCSVEYVLKDGSGNGTSPSPAPSPALSLAGAPHRAKGGNGNGNGGSGGNVNGNGNGGTGGGNGGGTGGGGGGT